MKSMKAIVMMELFCLMLSGCSTIPTGFVSTTDRMIVHKASGTTFAERIASFSMVSLASHNAEGTDISVGYQEKGALTIMLNMRVYPGRSRSGQIDLSDEYRAAVKEVIDFHSEAEIDSESRSSQTLTGGSMETRMVTFGYHERFGGKEQDLFSILAISKFKGWFIVYRMTLPLIRKDLAWDLFAEFILQTKLPTIELL